MLRLVHRELFEPPACPGREAGVRDCFGVVFREGGAVEVVLEVLEGGGVLRGGGWNGLVTRPRGGEARRDGEGKG